MRITIPENIQIINAIDLDRFLPSIERKCDALLVLKINNTKMLIVIEQTSHPEIKDLERLKEMPNKLREKNLINHSDAIIVKILHHKGMDCNLLVRAARSYKIELQKCRNTVDLKQILIKRKIMLT